MNWTFSIFLVCLLFSGELSDVQALYKQSTEHAAEQSHLIKQLEGLNLDTQRVLRNQEEAHTADTNSYQRVFTHARTHAKPQTHHYYNHFVLLRSGLSHCGDLFPG